MCMIDWSINGGEEEEDGMGMYCSRLGIPAGAHKQDELYIVWSIDWLFETEKLRRREKGKKGTLL